MESLAISLGVAPYLAGRTTLAVGILVVWYGLQGVLATGEFTWKSVGFGILAGFAAIAVQVLVAKLREFADAAFEPMREAMRRGDAVAAVVVAVCFAAYVLSMAGGLAVETGGASAQAGGLSTLSAGVTSSALVVLGAGGFAYTFARLRAWIAGLFDLFPLSDEPGVRRALFFAESLWTVGGLVLALLLPLLGLVTMLLTLGFLVASGVLMRRLTRGPRGDCACGAKPHLAASRCPGCGAARPPRGLGRFGRVLAEAPADPAQHRLSLLSDRRCPSCAEKLTGSGGRVTCSACSEPPLSGEEEARAFAARADAGTAVLLPVCGLLGLVPVLGLGVALALYRLSPAGALGRFAAWHDRLGTRLLRGAVLTFLVLVQPMPLFGALSVVGFVAATHAWTRRAYLASVARQFDALIAAPADAAAMPGS